MPKVLVIRQRRIFSANLSDLCTTSRDKLKAGSAPGCKPEAEEVAWKLHLLQVNRLDEECYGFVSAFFLSLDLLANISCSHHILG